VVETETSVATLIGLASVFGLVVGSFLNVVIYRLPRGESIVFPGSHCPGCDTPIKLWDNIPVVSYLLLGGRCRQCGTRISLRYPMIEALAAIVFAVIMWRFGPVLFSLVWMLFASALITAAVIDLDHQIIPDEISLGGLVAGLIGMPALLIWSGAPVDAALMHTVGGALLGGGMLWTIGFLHARVCVAMGRHFDHWPGEGEEVPRPSSLDYWSWFPGMGFGDVKLLAMIGAFLGPFGVLVTIVAASLVGLVLGLGWVMATRSLQSPFGFGPAIALGALLALLVPPGLLGLG
jgi:leader peptidase (prepilin peptidase)/N-methyltransferase